MNNGLKNILLFSIVPTLMLIVIGFASVKSSSRKVNDVNVEIKTRDGNYFTDRQEVLSLINGEKTDYVLGSSIGQLDLKMLEARVEGHPFVKDAQVFRDVRGNLVIDVSQAKPVARILNRSGEDTYIDDEGYLLPPNGRQTARVPIIELDREFTWKENITETAYGQQLLNLLLYIERDQFWRAQIAGLVIEKDGEIVLHPQVTKQFITFGMPEELDQKFKKLELFYKEILPNKGWNTYSMVNLKFKNQIVCE